MKKEEVLFENNGGENVAECRMEVVCCRLLMAIFVDFEAVEKREMFLYQKLFAKLR